MTGPEGVQLMDQDASLDLVPSMEPPTVMQATEAQEMEGIEGGNGVAGPNSSEPPDDPLFGSYTWVLRDFLVQEQRIESEIFEAGGYPWKVLCFPRGNNKPDFLSLYLMADGDDAPMGWCRSAKFKLTLLNHKDPGASLFKDASHNFSAQEVDWGFTQFAQQAQLRSPEQGFLQDGALSVKVDVRVSPADDLGYDSKKETGYVGLKNQGATCYMNSLLQTLYNINLFRKAVYHMPTSEEESPSTSMPLALQGVFYKLQFGRTPVSTTDLTQSFGWDSSDAFQQHDVQELNRILCDRLEEKMKGTRVEGKINQLFEGQTVNYIQCINVDYKSSRKESFMDVQLDVKGCSTIYDSFARYCEVETLEGENQYNAEGHGMQDARKGVMFESFPPVLQLQLKRFEYDFMKDTMVKINDRYEFYDELDLDQNGARKFLSPEADPNTHNVYKLLAVLVHSGGVHGGHYYAYIRPDGQQWLKFDDERVEKADGQRAVEDNWGGGRGAPAARGFTKFANAYMLVYVRMSEWDSVMCGVGEEDISDHVRARLKAEQEERERRKREKAEAHLYSMVRVATDQDLAAQIGSSRFFDLVDHEKVRAFKLPRRAPFSEVRRLVESELAVPPGQQRYWRWSSRQNGTYRPSTVLEADKEEVQVASLADTKRQYQRGAMSSINLFLESPQSPDTPLPPLNSKTDILLFIKLYSPGGEGGNPPPSLTYAGRVFAPKSAQVQELLPVLSKLAGLPPDTRLDAYEEIKFEPNPMVELLAPTNTFDSSQLENGDIIVIQPRHTADDARRLGLPYPTARDFLTYVRYRHIVRFKRLENPNEDGVQLELRADMAYDDVSAALAQKLGLDHPLKLRFTGQNAYSGLPRPTPIRWKTCGSLEEMIRSGHYGQAPLGDTLFYEVLDLPLPEFEGLMNFKVYFYNEKLEEGPCVPLRVPRDHTVHALLEALRGKLPPEAHGGRPLRLMEIYQWKIWQVYDPAFRVETITDSPWHLRAEVVAEEDGEQGDDPQALHVHCLQITREGQQKAFAFSDPFLMRVTAGETVGELKGRVQRRLQVTEEEFQKWGVFLCANFAAPEPLADDVIISQRIPGPDLQRLYARADRTCIGFEHENKNPRRTHAHINRTNSFYGQERQLKIRA